MDVTFDRDAIIAALTELADGAIAVFDRYYPEEELSERAIRQLNERFGGAATV